MERAEKPVDVICVCSADGEIRPLRLHMEDDAKQMIRIDIDQILRIERNDCYGAESITFLCGARVYNYRRLFEIKYAVKSHIWSVRPYC